MKFLDKLFHLNDHQASLKAEALLPCTVQEPDEV